MADEFEPTTLEDALGNETIDAAEAPEVVEQPVIETQEAAPQDAEPVNPETPSDEPEPEKPWTYSMAMDEKAKRKAAQEELKETKARLAALEYQQKQAKPQEAPSVFEDENAYAQHWGQQAVAPVMSEVQQLKMQLAEVKHGDDFKAANAWFDTLPPNQQQALNAQYGGASDPYSGLISEFKKSQILNDIGEDPAAYKQRIIDEYLAAQGGQAPAQTQQPRPSQVKITPSVMSAPNVSARGGPKWAGPTALSDILPE